MGGKRGSNFFSSSHTMIRFLTWHWGISFKSRYKHLISNYMCIYQKLTMYLHGLSFDIRFLIGIFKPLFAWPWNLKNNSFWNFGFPRFILWDPASWTFVHFCIVTLNNDVVNKIKNTKYHTVGILPNSNRKIVEWGKIDTTNIQIQILWHWARG